jgi:hypothetical protein
MESRGPTKNIPAKTGQGNNPHKISSPMQISNEYWDSILRPGNKSTKFQLWRQPVYQEYEKLIAQWSATHRLDYVLKTDLFEEATNAPGLAPFSRVRTKFFVGMDHSFVGVVKARMAMKRQCPDKDLFICCDVRHLPFKPDVFDLIISNSTLDHFTAKKFITISLKEIFRVTKRSAGLLLVLDNPLNPLIFIRNHLPYTLLKAIGLIPYYMGSLVSKQQLIQLMERIGFKIHRSSYISHCPRILLVGAEKMLTRLGNNSLRGRLIAIMERFERLRNSPTRSVTAQFIMVEAAKHDHHPWEK